MSVIYADPDEHGLLDIHALDYPFAGVVLEMVRTAPGQSRSALIEWLQQEFIPNTIAATRAAMCLISLDADLPDAVARKTSRIPRAYEGDADQRVTLLWFVEIDPKSDWQKRFVPHLEKIDGGGFGTLEFSSPFIPLIPGTDRFIDGLR